MTTLAELGEFGLLAELERRGLAQGIEHDAAVVDGLVVTQDMLVEGVHFRFDLLGWQELGVRAAAVNVSDLAAAGADPVALLVSLGLPAETELEDVLELYAGLNERGVPVRGGDTTRAERVTLSVTALGRSDRVPGRAGACPGDVVVVTGPLGATGVAFRNGCIAAGAGSRGRREAAGRGRDGHARPLGRPRAGRGPHRGALRRPSGDRVERVPLAEGAELDDVAFGEDYELLATTSDPLGFQPIGRVEEGEGVGLTLGGEPYSSAGWSTSANHCSKWARGRAPTTAPRGSPPEKRITVGIESTS